MLVLMPEHRLTGSFSKIRSPDAHAQMDLATDAAGRKGLVLSPLTSWSSPPCELECPNHFGTSDCATTRVAVAANGPQADRSLAPRKPGARDERIRQLPYQIWEEEGRPDGRRKPGTGKKQVGNFRQKKKAGIVLSRPRDPPARLAGTKTPACPRQQARALRNIVEVAWDPYKSEML